MHYLDIAQIRVIVVQPDFSLARVMNSCGDAIEVGDFVIPLEPIAVPTPPRPRPFSPTMTTNSGVKGMIVSTKSVLLNFGSMFRMSDEIPGVRGNDRLGVTERGIAAAGSIVYINLGQDQNVKPGDIFIVYRNVDFDERLFPAPREIERLRTRAHGGRRDHCDAGRRARFSGRRDLCFGRLVLRGCRRAKVTCAVSLPSIPARDWETR